MSDSSKLWSYYEIQDWEDPPMGRIHYWSPIVYPGDFEYFVNCSLNWTDRALRTDSIMLALDFKDNPDDYWKDPRTHKAKLSWRGHACANWSLSSSAQRLANGEFFSTDISVATPKELAEIWSRSRRELDNKEDELLDWARNECHKADLSDIEVLAWAQHEGAKYPDDPRWNTRLLDVTANPMVALFFGTQDCLDHVGDECDGRIIAFDDILERLITGEETKEEIRNEIGAIWRPESQSPYQEAQEGAFLIMGVLPVGYESMLEVLRDSKPTVRGEESVRIGNRDFPVFAGDFEVIGRLAERLQRFSVPGLRPPFFGGSLAFKKSEASKIPSNVVQSIRISGKDKKKLRKYLESIGVTEKVLFPE